MANTRAPRHGSMQFWPRKRARSETPRVHMSFVNNLQVSGGFYGYKIGMTHAFFKDKYANSVTKGLTIMKPVTILECPPMKVVGIRLYKKIDSCLRVVSDVFSDKVDKELSRRMNVPKAAELKAVDYDDVRIVVYTQPKLTSLPKKIPEIFEVTLGGKTKEEKLAFAKEKLGKEISVSEVLKVNELVDVHAVTRGKGYQGPVKRFGVQIRSHKAEKTKRGPASLGPWRAYPHFMYRVAHAGQMGYHLRTEYNKAIVSISDDVSKVNPAGGFVRYGLVKGTYILLMGSIPGPSKRMVRLVPSIRPNPKKKTDNLQLVQISTLTKQG